MVKDMNPVSLSNRIDAVVAERAMLAHPFYRAWSEGRLTKSMLGDYAAQYFHHVDAFPQAVSAVHSTCPARDGRRMLAENLAEEEGLGDGRTDHASLWLSFAAGLGVDEKTARAVALNPETLGLISAFRALSHKSYAAGLAALYAYERQLPDVATTKIEGLERFYGVRDPDTVRFFTVHQAADVEHAEVCRRLLDALPAGEWDEAEDAAKTLADALCDFLTGMHRECRLAA